MGSRYSLYIRPTKDSDILEYLKIFGAGPDSKYRNAKKFFFKFQTLIAQSVLIIFSSVNSQNVGDYILYNFVIDHFLQKIDLTA